MSFGKTEEKKVEQGSAPKFVVPLEDLTVIVGSSIDLMCKVSGIPTPAIKWYFHCKYSPNDILAVFLMYS